MCSITITSLHFNHEILQLCHDVNPLFFSLFSLLWVSWNAIRVPILVNVEF